VGPVKVANGGIANLLSAAEVAFSWAAVTQSHTRTPYLHHQLGQGYSRSGRDSEVPLWGIAKKLWSGFSREGHLR